MCCRRSAPKAGEACTTDHVGDAQRHHRLRQQGRDKENGANKAKQVGKGDVGEADFQQAVEYRVVVMLSGSRPI